MPFSPEVNSFQRKISRDQRLMPGRQAQYGSVVTDSGHNVAPGPRLAANPSNQRFFRKRHGETI
jgi:hypothetical protein